jgi:hypothetical protein
MNTQNLSIEDMISAAYNQAIDQEKVAEVLANPEVTPVASETTKASEVAPKATKPAKEPRVAKAPKVKNPYPFMTKAEIATRLATDSSFRQDCLIIIYNRQTCTEQDTLQTQDKNARGFMSSHSVNGSLLAKKILASEELSPEDEGKIEGIICKYTKQLAGHFRSLATEADPSLKTRAAAFGI